MDQEDKKKYMLFAGIVIVFLIGSAYFSSEQSARTYSVPSFQQLREASDYSQKSQSSEKPPFELKLPTFFEDNTNRISNDNCGISFKIPEDWTVTNVQEGDRYCQYYIDNPDKRGATLAIGIPGILYPQEYVPWAETVDAMSKEYSSLKSTSVRNADEAYKTDRTVFPPDGPQGLIGISHPMYIFRKGNAVYYMRYGYVDDDGRDMLQDIDSVVSSIQFPQSASFYETPLRSSP